MLREQVDSSGGFRSRRRPLSSAQPRSDSPRLAVDVVLFDKTGTLTLGHPRLVASVALNGLHEDELLTLAATAEKFSEHPLGRALVRAAGERDCQVGDPRDFEALLGVGVRALAGGHTVLVGRAGPREGHDAEGRPDAAIAVTPATARVWSR